MKIKELPCILAPSRKRKISEDKSRKDQNSKLDEVLRDILNGAPRKGT